VLPLVGGLLCIISGALNIIFAAFFTSSLVGLGICLAMIWVFSILAILGGICAVLKRLFGMAIIGAIFAILNPFTYGVGFVMGLVALILIAIGKDNFVPVGGFAPQPPMYYQPPPY
jgi:hypothetical protein